MAKTNKEVYESGSTWNVSAIDGGLVTSINRTSCTYYMAYLSVRNRTKIDEIVSILLMNIVYMNSLFMVFNWMCICAVSC